MILSLGLYRQVSHFVLFLFCFFALSSAGLQGATIIVGPPPASIQAAIDSASSGDTIQLSAGIYVEPIQIISKSLNIIGAGETSTVIQAPSASTPLTQYFTYSGINFWCVLIVDNQAAPTSQVVNISDLTVSGDTQQDTTTLPSPAPGFYGNSNRFFAIGYHNAAGSIDDVHTTSTRQSSNFNELAGGGIVNASDTGTVAFSVTNSLIDFYQRSGIDCRGAALTATISNNTVNRGYVLIPNTTTAAPNGIQFSGSTSGSITNNIVNGNISTVANAQSSGIIPFGAGPDLVVSGNDLDSNDVGIAAINNGANLTIENNTLTYSMTQGVNVAEGIIVQDTNGLSTISSNVINNIPDIAMELITDTGSNESFALSDNQFIGSQTGIIVTGAVTDGPVITMDGDCFMGTVGYYIQEVDAPNDIWPSTATVTFDGLLSGHITMAQFDALLTKIYDQHNDPALGLVLDYIDPTAPSLISINPSFGPAAGGNEITITGTSFISSDTTVFFGATAATDVTVLSDSSITATAPAGLGLVDVTVVTPFGTSPIVTADQYTYVTVPPTPPAAPFDFVGILKKNEFLGRIDYAVISRWEPSPSLDIISYRIYREGHLVEEIDADSPLIFVTTVLRKFAATKFKVVAVNANYLESAPVSIEIFSEESSSSISSS